MTNANLRLSRLLGVRATPPTSMSRKRQRLEERGAGDDLLPEQIPRRDDEESPQRCGLPFFDVPCEQLACDLLGAVLCHETLEGVCKGRIVETEAYLGAEDKAAHSYQGRRTERNEAMYMPPGTAYVYLVYGVHCCANISSQGDGAAVLIRALEPVAGLEVMRGRRKQAKKTKDLCSGPAKLCQAMGIKLAENKINLCSSSTLWLEKDGYAIASGQIQKGSRVGVAYAGEKWAHAPLRFYIRGNQCVSKK